MYGRVEIKAKLPRGDWIYPRESFNFIIFFNNHDDRILYLYILYNDIICDLFAVLLLESSIGKNKKKTQIRVASAVGNENLTTRRGKDISGKILWGGTVVTSSNSVPTEQNNFNQQEQRGIKYNDDQWSKKFHVYELLWSPNRIVLKVDGEKYEDKIVELPNDNPVKFFLFFILPKIFIL